MGKVLETFGAELDKEVLEGFMRQEATLQKFSSFFRGEISGRLFVFYQPETADGEVSEPLPLMHINRANRNVASGYRGEGAHDLLSKTLPLKSFLTLPPCLLLHPLPHHH